MRSLRSATGVAEALAVDDAADNKVEDEVADAVKDEDEDEVDDAVEDEADDEEDNEVDDEEEDEVDELVGTALAVVVDTIVVTVVEVAAVIVWLTVMVEATVTWLAAIEQAAEMTVTGYLVKTEGVERSRLAGASVTLASASAVMDSRGRYQVWLLLESKTAGTAFVEFVVKPGKSSDSSRLCIAGAVMVA